MRRAIALALAAAMMWTAAARADQSLSQPPQVVGVHVGFDGKYKAGLWAPVEVALRGFGNCRGRVCVTTPDGDGVPSRVFSSPDDILSVSPGKETTVRLYVRFGRVHGWMTVQFLVHDRPVAEETFQASPDGGPKSFPPAIESRPLVVCLGDAAKTAEEAAALGGLDPQQRPVVARIDRLDGLPDQWYGYEGVDALVLTAAQAGGLQATSARAERRPGPMGADGRAFGAVHRRAARRRFWGKAGS